MHEPNNAGRGKLLKMKKKHITILTAACLLLNAKAMAGDSDNIGRQSLTDGLTMKVEMSGTTSNGDFAPMWLSSNRYGIVSPYANSAYQRAMLARNAENDSCKLWKIGYGVDVTINEHGMAPLMIHQAYGEVKYKLATLTIGQKEIPMEMKNNSLSSGSQALGINAMPIPQVRLELNDYWTIPLGGRWVGFKGHLAFGRYTDDNWQKDFTRKESKYVENQLYHSKAGFLRIHKPTSPLTITLGLEMAAQFGGTSHRKDEKDVMYEQKHNTGFKAFFNALLPGFGGDEGEGVYANSEGNTLGSWIARVDYKAKGSTFSLYADKFFEDHSAMFQLDYDGYGTGEDWNKKVGKRMIVYDFSDIMLGAEWKKHEPWYVDNVVVEYLHTKYQSGPVYHDRTPDISDHIAGKDNYYYHHIFTGWHHWGMVSGNPFYLSPIYNEDRENSSHGTRFIAWHLGVGGTLAQKLSYRILASWQRCWGTYYYILPDPQENTSVMAEASYKDFSLFGHKGWNVSGAIAFDNGKLRGNNFGVQMTVSKSIRL